MATKPLILSFASVKRDIPVRVSDKMAPEMGIGMDFSKGPAAAFQPCEEIDHWTAARERT